MKEITTQIIINAPIEKVWQVLIDFESYPSWNPFILHLEGDVVVGSQIKVNLPQMTFKPTITSFESYSQLSWIGHLLFRGLFDGEHFFVLSENTDGTTLFEHKERFSGVLVPLLSKELNKTGKGFIAMNEALKLRVENSCSCNMG